LKKREHWLRDHGYELANLQQEADDAMDELITTLVGML
jgi:hypothetical protein